MVATPITKSTRFIRPGVTKVYFVITMSNYLSPIRSELNAGTDLTREIADISGFQVTSEAVDTPDLNSRFTSKIPGMITADDSSLSFYASSNSIDVRSLLPRDTVGYVVWLDEGDIAGRTMDVFPVQVSSAPKVRSLSDPAQIQVQFTITNVPAENVVVP